MRIFIDNVTSMTTSGVGRASAIDAPTAKLFFTKELHIRDGHGVQHRLTLFADSEEALEIVPF